MPSDPEPLQFLADMGIAGRIVGWLRDQGYSAIHLRDQGLERMPDIEIFRKAAKERRITLTFDLDFGEIAAFTQEIGSAVVIFRLHNTKTPHVFERLQTVLRECNEALRTGAVIVVEETRIRIRYFLPRV